MYCIVAALKTRFAEEVKVVALLQLLQKEIDERSIATFFKRALYYYANYFASKYFLVIDVVIGLTLWSDFSERSSACAALSRKPAQISLLN